MVSNIKKTVTLIDKEKREELLTLHLPQTIWGSIISDVIKKTNFVGQRSFITADWNFSLNTDAKTCEVVFKDGLKWKASASTNLPK